MVRRVCWNSSRPRMVLVFFASATCKANRTAFVSASLTTVSDKRNTTGNLRPAMHSCFCACLIESLAMRETLGFVLDFAPAWLRRCGLLVGLDGLGELVTRRRLSTGLQRERTSRLRGTPPAPLCIRPLRLQRKVHRALQDRWQGLAYWEVGSMAVGFPESEVRDQQDRRASQDCFYVSI